MIENCALLLWKGAWQTGGVFRSGVVELTKTEIPGVRYYFAPIEDEL